MTDDQGTSSSQGDEAEIRQNSTNASNAGGASNPADCNPADCNPADYNPADCNPAMRAFEPVDFLLEQGTQAELSAMRDEVARDPVLALEVAETVSFLEDIRSLKTEASPQFAGKLHDVVVKAERFSQSHFAQKPRYWHLPLVMGLAASVTFFALWWVDAQRLWQRQEARSFSAASMGGRPAQLYRAPQSNVSEEPISDEQAAWEVAVSEISRRLDLESASHLRMAFDAAVADQRDSLDQWLDPQNTIGLLRLEHELRASAKVRSEALRRRGSLPEVDDRVQALATDIGDALIQKFAQGQSQDRRASVEDVAEVSLSLRALSAAGKDLTRNEAMAQSGDWIVTRIPDFTGERLVLALSGLMELALVSGDHGAIVAQHGQRLIDEVLQPADDTWRRWRPDLLSGKVAAGTLGEAGRVLAKLPAFGVDAAPCKLLRQLALGQLRERRDSNQDRPEVLAAMLYGCSDLLDTSTNEQERIAFTLRRWKPKRLAPDYITVQQLAWGRSPASPGYTRLQLELRQITVLPTPEKLKNQAAFCLCLSTNFAGIVGGLLPSDTPLRRS